MSSSDTARHLKISRQQGTGLVALLGCMLAVGCGGVDSSAATSATGFAPAAFAAADSTDLSNGQFPTVSSGLQLFIYPDPSSNHALQAIQAAQQSIDVEMYMMTDNDIIQGLVAAAQPPRNVKVRVLLDAHPFTLSGGSTPAANPNQPAATAFQGTPVQFAWTSPQFTYTHQKSMVIDNQTAWIMTANMSKSARLSNREYLIADANANDIAEVESIFSNDWSRTTYSPGPAAAHLAISPVNSRAQLLALINLAHTSIALEDEVIGDAQVQQALIARAQAGVNTQVLIASPAGSTTSKVPQVAQQLTAGGCTVKYLTTPYLHAKAIVVDNQTVYTGSVNLTTNSMDHNRELGIMISQPDIVQGIAQTVTQDLAAGTPSQ